MITNQSSKETVKALTINFHKEVFNVTSISVEKDDGSGIIPGVRFETPFFSSPVCILYREPATLRVAFNDCICIDILVPSLEAGLSQLGIPDRSDLITRYQQQGMHINDACERATEDMSHWNQFKRDCMEFLENTTFLEQSAKNDLSQV